MKIATVIGTRPEIIKMAPIIPEFDREHNHRFIFTGQHYSHNMVEIFLEEMQVRRPDVFLNVESSETDKLSEAIRGELAQFGPDLLMIYGDTNSTLAAARACPPGCRICHIEAGIRSFDERMPEELNRIETDSISHFKLAPTGLARYFLHDLEGYSDDEIIIVGNLVVDAYRIYRERILSHEIPFGLKPQQYYLLTMHRKENVDEPERLRAIMESLAGLTKPVVFPVHPRTYKRMQEFGVDFPANVTHVEPISYFPFMRLMHDCDVVVTDSGGVQEEAITQGVPCVTLRDNTERMETVFLKANVLYDAEHRRDLGKVIAEMSARREFIARVKNPYGNGDAAQKIMEFIKERC